MAVHSRIIIENLNNANKYLDNTKLIIAEFIKKSEYCDTITNDFISLKTNYDSLKTNYDSLKTNYD